MGRSGNLRSLFTALAGSEELGPSCAKGDDLEDPQGLTGRTMFYNRFPIVNDQTTVAKAQMLHLIQPDPNYNHSGMFYLLPFPSILRTDLWL